MYIDAGSLFRGNETVRDIDVMLDLSDFDAPLSNVRFIGQLRNRVGVVSVVATISGDCDAVCDRCLEPMVLHLEYKVDTVITENSSKDESVVMEKGRLDLDKTAYDLLMLKIPTKCICGADCKGLCPSCGANLNIEECNCEKGVL